MEAPRLLSVATKRIKVEKLEDISIKADHQANPPPDWLLLPDNLYVQIFDNLNPGKLLSIRRVHPKWQRLAEASAQTRNDLVLIQCGVQPSNFDNWHKNCCLRSLTKANSLKYFSTHFLNHDGSSFSRKRDWFVYKHAEANGLKCASFNAVNAQLVAQLFPQIRHLTVAHHSISSRHIDQLLYLLANWSANLRTFKLHSEYTLEGPDARVTRARAVALQPTEAFLNRQLTLLFRQLKSLPELKHLTLNYLKGKINSTVSNYAFIARLEELHLDRMSLEANFQAACQRYLAPTAPGTPLPVLRRFTNMVKQFDSIEREFARFLQYSPEALPLAAALTWNQQCALHHLTDLPNFLLRFSSIGCLSILQLQIGTSLGPLSRTLAHHNVTVLCIGTKGNGNELGEEEEEAETELVPVPSVRGLTIILFSSDHNRIYPLLAQIPTVFPRLSSLILIDCRHRCFNAPSVPPFSTTADEPRVVARFARKLLAAYPLATQSIKYQQVQSFLTIARQINTSFPNLYRSFAFKSLPGSLLLHPVNQQ